MKLVIAILLSSVSSIRLGKKHREIDEGYEDTSWEPNPIYKNTIHKDLI
jgi:hypothetical protein